MIDRTPPPVMSQREALAAAAMGTRRAMTRAEYERELEGVETYRARSMAAAAAAARRAAHRCTAECWGDFLRNTQSAECDPFTARAAADSAAADDEAIYLAWMEGL